MGVMSCSRKGCDSIMCDTYVDDIGYVCTSCQYEFKDYLSSKGITQASDTEIRAALDTFLETSKDFGARSGDMTVDDFFNQYDNNNG